MCFSATVGTFLLRTRPIICRCNASGLRMTTLKVSSFRENICLINKLNIYRIFCNPVTIPDVGPHSWIKFNSDQVGYYRVNYPKEMWQTLTDALKQNVNVSHSNSDFFFFAVVFT